MLKQVRVFQGSAWPYCQNRGSLTFQGSAMEFSFWLLFKLLWWVAEFAISPFVTAAKVVTPLNWHPCELATFSEQILQLNSVTILPSTEGGGRLWHHMHNLLINLIIYSNHDCKTIALWWCPTVILHLQEVATSLSSSSTSNSELHKGNEDMTTMTTFFHSKPNTCSTNGVTGRLFILWMMQ